MKPISLAVHKPFVAAPALSFKDRVIGAREKPKDDVDRELFYPDYSVLGAIDTVKKGKLAEEGEVLSARFAMERQQKIVDCAKGALLKSTSVVEQIKGYVHRLQAQAEDAQDDYISARFGLPPLQAQAADLSQRIIKERSSQKPSLSKEQLQRKQEERQGLDAKLAQARRKLPQLRDSMQSAEEGHQRAMASRHSQLTEALKATDEDQTRLESEFATLASLTQRHERLLHASSEDEVQKGSKDARVEACVAAHEQRGGGAGGLLHHQDFMQTALEAARQEVRRSLVAPVGVSCYWSFSSFTVRAPSDCLTACLTACLPACSPA